MISARRNWLDQQQYSKPDRSPMARHHQHSERKREGGGRARNNSLDALTVQAHFVSDDSGRLRGLQFDLRRVKHFQLERTSGHVTFVVQHFGVMSPYTCNQTKTQDVYVCMYTLSARNEELTKRINKRQCAVKTIVTNAL